MGVQRGEACARRRPEQVHATGGAFCPVTDQGAAGEVAGYDRAGLRRGRQHDELARRLPLEDGLDPRDTSGWSSARASIRRPTPRLSLRQEQLRRSNEATPARHGAFLPYVGQSACSAARRADLVSFLKTRAADFPGRPCILDQVVEQVGQCTALARAHAVSLASFLER